MKKFNRATTITEPVQVHRVVHPSNYDLFREPYREYCSECQEWVIALDGHCINNDAHQTSTFTPEERKSLFIKRSWEDGPETVY